MIIIVKKTNIILVALAFILTITVYSIAVRKDDATLATNGQNQQRTVLLDPGHGGEDPGAVSDYSGLKEKDVNFNIALKVKELLEKDNYKVMMTRTEDRLEYQEGTAGMTQKRKQDLLRRKKMMDEGGANIVVSIHLNKFPQTQYFGAQTFYPPNSPDSQKLAMNIQKSIKETVDPNNKREALVKKEPIIILKDSKTTTAIVECGFLSNEEEEKKLASTEYQEKLALCIKEGVKKYFEGK
ncbi:MAG: N-acetylmuramoyl-L-alanine amidase [Clostridia bacterium]|nr:N-acetylmuramoyl-L-alanine amidase [Clostridia bacterium]